MKLIFAIGCLVALLAVRGDDSIDKCRCWKNYAARRINGKVECHSVLSLATTPCNIPEFPGCKCEKAPVDIIVTDKYGMWCSGNGNKWPCENEGEWNTYEQECKDELFCIPNNHKSV